MGFEEALNAVKAGDEARLESLLAVDPKLLSATDEHGMSLLMQALYHRRTELLGRLSDRPLSLFEAAALGRIDRLSTTASEPSAGLEARSPDGFTAVHLAAFFARDEMVVWLLERGAEVNVVADNAMAVAPLHSAVAGGSAAVVETLIAAGVGLDARQHLGFTALMGAAANGRADLVELLLAAGADPRLESEEGQTAAGYARRAGDESLAALLDRTADV